MTTMHDETTTPTMEDAPKPKRRLWKIWIPLLALIIAIACWFQLVHQQKRSSHNYDQLQDSFNQTQSSTASLNEQISALKNQITTQNDQLQALQTNFDRMQSANSSVEIDLALQQVDRYLQQANLTLVFNHDTSGAISLLKAADMRLSTVPNVMVIGLRQNIAHALVQLQAAPTVDYVGLLSKLAALRDQVANLPLFAINSKTNQFKTKTAQSTSNTGPALQDAWHKSLDTLKSLVIIRNRHQEITPLVSPTEEQFLRLNLQLILQQAQWAVLQHQQSVYQFSLNQADEWLQRYFADNDKATSAMQSDIDSLKAINLNPKTPNLGALIDKLHQVQANFKKARPNLDVSNTTSVAAIESQNQSKAPIVSIARPAHEETTTQNKESAESANTVTAELAKPAKPAPTVKGDLV